MNEKIETQKLHKTYKSEPFEVIVERLMSSSTDDNIVDILPDEERCEVCERPGCREIRGENFHAGTSYGSIKCDYSGTPPFADAEWADHPDSLCLWCANTGYPHNDESYIKCECPGLKN